jgi:hypothetical protein
VIRTQWGGKPEIRNHGRIFVGISGIDVSAFPLIRSIALHIRSNKNMKLEGIVQEHFGNSAFQDTGTQGGSVLETIFLNSRFMKSAERKPFQHFSNLGFGR